MPAATKRRKPIILAIAVAAVLVIVAAVIVVIGVSRVVATANMRVLVPAPAAAGGLARDYADERSPQFQAGLAQFRSRYATVLHNRITSYATAIYTNAAPGTPGSSASVAVLYAGFNSASVTLDTAGALQSGISSLSGRVADPTELHVTGLPAGMSAECVSGLSGGSPVAACVWVSDKTLAVFLALTGNTSANQLATLVKHMRPDLVHG